VSLPVEDKTTARVEVVDGPGAARGSKRQGAPVPFAPQQVIRLGDSGSSAELRLFGYDERQLEKKRADVLRLEIRFDKPRIHRFQNLVYLPKHDCLYDENGQRVLETCRRRGTKIVSTSPAPVRLPPSAQRADPPVVYCGGWSTHWGKFHTESINRMWALVHSDVPPDSRAFFRDYPRRDATLVDSFLRYANIDSERFIKVREATVFREVLVPEASFIPMSGAYRCHFTAPERVAEAICGPTRSHADQPVYLSRSRLEPKLQRFEGEEPLEDLLRERGVRVVHPESMSYEDQVRMFNRHSTFIGTLGSALHSLVYALPDHPIRTIIFEPYRRGHFASYVTVDLLKGIHGNYFHAKLLNRPRDEKLAGRKRGRFDIAEVFGALRSLGVI
jgi:hypothetical protein